MKNETKGIAPVIIAVIVIIVAAGVGIGAYVVVTRGGGTGGGGGGVGSASSLSFYITSTAVGQHMSGAFEAKDIGTSNLKIRFEGTYENQSMIVILDGATQTAWGCVMGTWTDMSSIYSTQYSTWSAILSTVQNTYLANWTGGTYTSPDGTITVSNIQVNPSLPDSDFTHTA